jgi:cytochrome c oxidase assembly protein subunit 15
VPEGIEWHGSLWMTLTSDPYLAHFIHRWWAWGVVVILVLLARAAKEAGNRRTSIAIHTAFGTQIFLGIATVMSGIALPLAVLHQALGALLLAMTVWGCHAIGHKA